MRRRVLLLGWLGLLCGGGSSGAPLSAQAGGGVGPIVVARESRWRWSTAAALGAWLAPGEVGRDRNQTGGREQLIARWSDGMALGLSAARETWLGGFELSGIQATSAVQVKNEFGVAFPNHGKRPFAWSANALLYPLGPLQGRRSRLLRPFLTAGLGGVLLSVDLDNSRDQTPYHSFHWSVGGGIRIATSPDEIPWWTRTFVELRVSRFQVWPNGPLRRFRAMAATAGLGMQF
ncbi:MAG TPA: hypothetical protein VGQ73_01825 [Gemmatimonadales bacterium]|jgi:hypothetical protein|nr:hypothetical protein [Gemmatimonadales bacterium]